MDLALTLDTQLPLVEQLVQALRQRIDERLLRPGARLPAIRQMAQQHKISRFTVVEAYERLVAQGYLQSRRGAGFFVTTRTQAPTLPQVTETARNYALDTAWLMRSMLTQDESVLKVSAGWLPPHWLDSEGITRTLRQLARQTGDAAQWVHYGAPKGDAGLRTQLQIVLAGRDIAASPEQILLTTGASQALDLISRHFLQPGDAVLVDDPGYFNYFGALRLQGAHLLGVPRTPNGPDVSVLARLAEQYRPKLFITHSVLHNPTGSSLNAATAYRVLQLAEQYDFMIAEDDTYGDFHPGGAIRLAALDQLQRVLYLNSFSKTLSANLRVGYVAANPALLERLTDIKLLTTVGSSPLAERVIHQLLVEGHYRKHIERLQTRLAHSMARVGRMLERLNLPFSQPAGGLFLWPELPPQHEAPALARAAASNGIVLAPGTIFRPQLAASPHLRINVSYADDVRLERFLAQSLDV